MDSRLQRYSVARFLTFLTILAGTAGVALAGGWVSSDLYQLLVVGAWALAAVAVSTWWMRTHGARPGFLYVQFAVDVALATALCWATSKVYSPFQLLYFPVIASAAWLLGMPGALAGATLASLSCLLLFALGRTAADSSQAQLVLYYEAMFRVFALYLLAGLAGTLAESAERSGRELIEARRTSQVLAVEHQMVLDVVRAGVVTAGADGRIEALNPSARALLGDVAGEPLDDVLPAGRTASPTGAAWEEERADGQRWVCCAADLGAGGRVVVIEDISELHRMRERQARDDRLVGVGRLAASMAHEIRNPLASLSGSLQMIAEEHPSRLATLALTEAERLNRLVEDFLTSSRPPSLARRPVDVAVLVTDIVEAFTRDPRYRETVRVACAAESAPALVDPDRIRQIVWNLLLNGAQAMPRGGTIAVQVANRPAVNGVVAGVAILVADEGIGVPAAERQRIFDPFFTTRTGGSGLGLALVDQVVRGHGGTIHVGDAPSGGTEFRLWLPLEASGVG